MSLILHGKHAGVISETGEWVYVHRIEFSLETLPFLKNVVALGEKNLVPRLGGVALDPEEENGIFYTSSFSPWSALDELYNGVTLKRMHALAKETALLISNIHNCDMLLIDLHLGRFALSGRRLLLYASGPILNTSELPSIMEQVAEGIPGVSAEDISLSTADWKVMDVISLSWSIAHLNQDFLFEFARKCIAEYSRLQDVPMLLQLSPLLDTSCNVTLDMKRLLTWHTTIRSII